MWIKPVPGRLVRDPLTMLELREAREVPDGDPFWLRRLRSKDVEVCSPLSPIAVGGNRTESDDESEELEP